MFNSRQILASLGCIMLFYCAACERRESGPDSPPTVLYMPLKAEKVELKRDFPGRVTAAARAEIRPQASGIVLERLFEEGEEVRAGQLLYKIDDAPFRAAHEEARARLFKAEARENAARRQMERSVNLSRSNAIPIREKEEAIAEYREVMAEIEAAREQLKKAAVELEYTRITAPVSGRIGRSLVLEGSLVSSGQEQPMAIITQLSPIYVDVALPVPDLLALRRHAPDKSAPVRKLPADIMLEDGSWLMDQEENRQQCEALFTETTSDEATGSVALRLSCANDGQMLLPGMYVKASLPLSGIEQGFSIPRRSVGRDNRNRPIIYILNKTGDDLFRLEERQVSLQMENGTDWVVTGDIRPGDLLLVEGLQKAGNGRLVRGREK